MIDEEVRSGLPIKPRMRSAVYLPRPISPRISISIGAALPCGRPEAGAGIAPREPRPIAATVTGPHHDLQCASKSDGRAPEIQADDWPVVPCKRTCATMVRP